MVQEEAFKVCVSPASVGDQSDGWRVDEDGSRTPALAHLGDSGTLEESIDSSRPHHLQPSQATAECNPLANARHDQSSAALPTHPDAAPPTTAGGLHSDVAVVASSLSDPAEARRTQPPLRFVRITRPEDVVRATGIAREFHSESRYRHIPFSEDKFLRLYERMVARSDATLVVYVERGEEIVGAMLAEIGEYFLGTGSQIATNQVLYVSGKVRGTAQGGRIAAKLMRLFIDWAKSKGVDEIHIHATSGIEPERTDKFLKHLGLQPYGGNYAARLNS